MLKDNIINLHPFNFALGDIDGFMPFYINEFSPSSSLLKMEEEHVKNFPDTAKVQLQKVEIKKLDTFSKNLKIEKEVLVKMDVQGFEEKVIKGGISFFNIVPKIVIVEASVVKLYQNEPSFEELFDLLRGMGYQYKGNLNQLYSPINNIILQVDSIFIK